MKKALSLVLSLALLCTLALPAAAAEEADQRLTQVTLKVKAALNIPDSFDTFSGDLNEGDAIPQWYLNWSGTDERIIVTADENGKVLSYNRSSSSTEPYNPNDLRLPKRSMEDCRAIADTFLSKVLDSSFESASFSSTSAYSNPGSDYVTIHGRLLFHKLPTPFSIRVNIRQSDGVVTGFTRSDSYNQFLGDVPSAKAGTAQGPAAQALLNTLSLRLEYVQDNPGEPAVLRYLPNSTDSFYVDAQTGKLVNLTKLIQEIQDTQSRLTGSMSGGAGMPAPDAAAKENGLSETELAGITKLEGVKAKEELDKTIRAVSALGLKNYTLSRFTYTVSQEDDSVSANLVYTKTANGETWRRTVTVDAKTGVIQSVSSYIPYSQERKPAVTQAAAQTAATDFLKAQQPEQFALTAPFTPEMPDQDANFYTFIFSHQKNGYFFPSNSLTAAVDVSDGSIASYSSNFDETVTFDSAEGIINAEEAAAAWAETYQVTLGYLDVPTKLDPSTPGAKPLLLMGYHYYSTLKLGYSMDQPQSFIGLDAKTGKPVDYPASEQSTVTYSDLEGVWGRAQIEELAAYGYGWLGGTLNPQSALTQRDLLALLASVDGYYYHPDTDPQADALYQWAYENGLITKAQRQDSMEITRIAYITLLLDQGNYSEVAALKGIYRTDFTDASSIPEGSLGYAALAQAMGIVTGDKNGNLAPNRTATRLEALLMLYNFMMR